MPNAVVLLWQLTQLAVMPVWSKRAGRQLVVEWHVSHWLLLATWVADFTVEAVPPVPTGRAWHVAHATDSNCV